MLIEVRLLHPLKARSPMLVTPSGRVIEVRLLQSSKALSPMLVTLSGILIEVRLLQPMKAPEPMLVTPSGMAYSFVLPAGQTSKSLPSLEKTTPSMDLYEGLPDVTEIEVRLLQ